MQSFQIRARRPLAKVILVGVGLKLAITVVAYALLSDFHHFATASL